MASLVTAPAPAFDLFPVAKHLEPALALFLEWGYSDAAVRRAVGHLARFGTAQCAADIDPEDRDVVEATLPMSAEWADPNHAFGTWELGAGQEAPR